MPCLARNAGRVWRRLAQAVARPIGSTIFLSKFCKKCGQPVAVMPPAATAAKFPPPASYTPKHLAEKILTSKSALEGERKLVTVLFADLKGSMELLADHPRAHQGQSDLYRTIGAAGHAERLARKLDAACRTTITTPGLPATN